MAGVASSFPIVLGYLPVAVAFGISAAGVGMSTGESVLISALIFAGASQFALVGMLAAGAPLAVASAAALALNLRHLLYGPLIAPLLNPAGRIYAVLLAFGMTDEVFATALAKLKRLSGRAPPGFSDWRREPTSPGWGAPFWAPQAERRCSPSRPRLLQP